MDKIILIRINAYLKKCRADGTQSNINQIFNQNVVPMGLKPNFAVPCILKSEKIFKKQLNCL
jgi:hypothetical protein